jgi:hypothetical protein
VIAYRYVEHDNARGPRWLLEMSRYVCACGNTTSVITNMRNGDQLMHKHATPDGSPCPEYSWQEGRERTRKICIAAGVTP